MSPDYLQAIACLAQRIYESGCLLKTSSKDLDSSWLWDSAVEALPELKDYLREVEETLNYQLSYMQCCSAIKWVYEYSPEVWAPLLDRERVRSSS